METKKTFIAFILILLLISGFARDPSRRAQRLKNRIEKAHQIEAMIHSKTFVFIATRALPQGFGAVDLTTNSNSIEFFPDRIKSYMPFFGRAYSIEYGGDGGIKFEAKPDEFNVTTLKRGKGYEINAAVSVTRDVYKLNLFVSPEGSASLTINSNQRSTIAYYGNITKPEEDRGK